MVVSLVLILVISFGSLFATLAAGWGPRLGLDLAGGTEVVLTPAHHRPLSASQLAVTEQIIRSRVAGIGVSGATVATSGNPPQVIVQVPGKHQEKHLLQQLVETAQLLFRPVECFANPFSKPVHQKPVKGKPVPTPPVIGAFHIPSCQQAYTLSPVSNPQNFKVTQVPSSLAGYQVSNVPPDPTFDHAKSINSYTATLPGVKNISVIEPGLPGQPAYPGIPGSRYVLFKSVMNGTAIGSASAQQTQTGEWVVNCTLTGPGSVQWDRVSQTYFHSYMAVDLDGIVQSAPLIQPTQATWSSFQGQVSISGNFTQAQANALAVVLQYGSLPVPLQILTDDQVSPTLGHAALVAGLGAGLAGLALVMLYVILYYRLLGLVVLVGLGVTAALLWAIISALGRTSVAPAFDLAGVTGLIVSIGITVDSYIVYFERLKDETRSGRTVRTSLDRGFASAWRTVLAADTVSLIAAVLLYFLAAGSVQGFAFFLGLSTLLDILVTWFYTRPAVYLLGRNERLIAMRGMGIARGLAVTSGAPA
jgi:preprotein translocase subunit SecD